MAEDGDGFAAEAADFAVGEDGFEAVADLGEIFVIVDGVEDEDAAAGLLGADAPFGGEIEGVVEDGLAVGCGDGDDGDLRVGFLVDFGAEGGELVAGFGVEDVGQVGDVAGGFGGKGGVLGGGEGGHEEREEYKDEEWASFAAIRHRSSNG